MLFHPAKLTGLTLPVAVLGALASKSNIKASEAKLMDLGKRNKRKAKKKSK